MKNKFIAFLAISAIAYSFYNDYKHFVLEVKYEKLAKEVEELKGKVEE